MRSRSIMLLWLALAFLLSSCGGGDEAGSGSATITLDELNASGITGTATLTDEQGKTKVVVTLENSGAGPQPIHIHPGTCANLDPAPKYPLQDVQNGTSETTIDVSLASLRDGTFAINAHKSAQEVQTYVACGDIE